MPNLVSRPIGRPFSGFYDTEGHVIRPGYVASEIWVFSPTQLQELLIYPDVLDAGPTIYAPEVLGAQFVETGLLNAAPILWGPIPYREGEIYAPVLDASPTLHIPSAAWDQKVELPYWYDALVVYHPPWVRPVGELPVDMPLLDASPTLYNHNVGFPVDPPVIADVANLLAPTVTREVVAVEVPGKWGPLPFGYVGLEGYIYPPKITPTTLHMPHVGETEPGHIYIGTLQAGPAIYVPRVQWQTVTEDWPDPFMSYPAASGPIHWNGVSDATISYLSFEDYHRADGQPIKLENCHNITIERIDTRGCTMGLVYALNCTNITIRYCRAENIAEEFAGQILDWAPAEAGTPGYFKNENDCNFYQFDKVDGFHVHDLKGRYGNMEDVFSHYSTSNGLVERLHFEGGVSTDQPTTTGKPSVVWTSDSGTGVILGDQSGHDVAVKDCIMVNCGQVLYQIAGGTNLGYDNCIGYGEGNTSQPWNAGVTSWGESQPCTGLNYTNMRVLYYKSDGSENGVWFDGRCTGIDTTGSDFSDNSLNIEDLRVWLGEEVVPVDAMLTPDMSSTAIDQVINSVGAYGTIGISGGVYYGFSVDPLDGQTFIGYDGAVLDGQNSYSHAFYGVSLYVTIRNVEVRNYDNPPQHGAIQGRDKALPGEDWYTGPYIGPGGWVVEDCEVHHNAGAGIMLGYDDAAIRRCNIHHNLQMGFGLSFGTNQECVDSEIAYNNYLVDYDWGWEAGGNKNWETTNLYLARNYSHDNHGPGLWSDHGNADTIYEDNVIVDNYGPGIFHEISYGCIVRNNTVTGNGLYYRGSWLWGAGIQIANAGFAEIYDNYLDNNGNGICFTNQGRGYGPLSCDVYNNQVSNSGLQGGASDTEDDITDFGPYDWHDNTYSNMGFAWAGSEIDYSTWLTYWPND